MRNDVNCPYCGAGQEICHDDGHGLEEDVLHQQECSKCDKTFVFTTGIIFVYEAQKADCLNGGEHKWKPTQTYPVEFTMMRCSDCDEERSPTESEWATIRPRREEGKP